jgi:hypothetical protein
MSVMDATDEHNAMTMPRNRSTCFLIKSYLCYEHDRVSIYMKISGPPLFLLILSEPSKKYADMLNNTKGMPSYSQNAKKLCPEMQ